MQPMYWHGKPFTLLVVLVCVVFVCVGLVGMEDRGLILHVCRDFFVLVEGLVVLACRGSVVLESLNLVVLTDLE